MMRTKWNDISKYRGELFGIAIISVILLHYFSQFSSDTSNRIVYIVSKIYTGAVGSVGVDIFVLLSGYGLYYSLSKGTGLRTYYLKRFQRVLFPYLIWGLIFWIIKDIVILRESCGRLFFDYSLLSFWVQGKQTFWYIAFICIMYIVSPLVFKLTESKARIIIGLAVACGISIICFLVSPTYFEKVEIALQRIPSFLIGMYFGKNSMAAEKKECKIPRSLMIFLCFSVPLKIITGLTGFPFARMVNAYYASFLIVIYTAMRNRIVFHREGLFRFFSRIGQYSLELYISHIAIRNLMNTLSYNMKNPLVYLFHMIIVIPIAFCLLLIQKIHPFTGKKAQ